MQKNCYLVVLLFACTFTSCKKSSSDNSNAGPQLYVFTRLAFNCYDFPSNSYFSTFDTSFKAPMAEGTMTPDQVKNIDLAFIFDSNDYNPGFADPLTASKHWYNDLFYTPFLVNSTGTRFYISTLNASNFDSVKTKHSLLATYFSDSSKLKTALTDDVFPTGSMLGFGLSPNDPVFGISSEFALDKVFGFINIATGKRGLIHVSASQEQYWPMPVYDHNTFIDIIKEQ
ncbi:MAG TPA: hypothetical protein VKT28_19395 [Puia sp.]|nr:hypothetical protein [Puia sp.]